MVIFDSGQAARVQVVELPDDAGVGASFRHAGRSWRVVGQRRSSRVLIAEAEPA